jgi:hypothetical protein
MAEAHIQGLVLVLVFFSVPLSKLLNIDVVWWEFRTILIQNAQRAKKKTGGGQPYSL